MNWNRELLTLWGKTGDEAGTPTFHPLAFHILDVAACAHAWLKTNPEWLARLSRRFAVDPDDLGCLVLALVALHDIGKCARGFQAKRLDLWPEVLGPCPKEPLLVRHDAAGLWMIKNFSGLFEIAARLLPKLVPSKRDLVFQATCGHHGEPVDARDIRNPGRDIGPASEIAAVSLAQAILGVFDPVPSCPIEHRHVALFSFALSGLTVLADWLGSNRNWFEFHAPSEVPDLASYWTDVARPCAERALRESGLLPAPPARAKRIGDLFPGIRYPTELQRFAGEVAFGEGPQLFVIEDMTGAGKTEAAAVLAYRLIEAGKARGLYVALPTMATANAMFDRLEKSYLAMFQSPPTPSIVLVHGKRRLVEGFENLPGTLARADELDTAPNDDPSSTTASGFCADWIRRSAKQAFLAQVGAGTIDQALLAVLPARHHSLRLHGLSDKVLIIDEAHAYDAYMTKEIEALLRFHAALGGSAIVLSATLPADKRSALVSAFRLGAEGQPWAAEAMAYPLFTSASRDEARETPLALRKELEREVDVQRVGSIDELHAIALGAAKFGAAVAVIRNTVDEAIASRTALAAEFDNVVLFHARFAMCDRARIEEDVVQRFGNKGNGTRNCILVATQVVEQSLDLDFDVMLTDLAPVDLLIQRAGRLWRHQRGSRPSVDRPILHVLSPEPPEDAGERWLSGLLPGTCGVYRNVALLWRSAKAVISAGKIVSKTSSDLAPIGSGEIRALVESVYGEDKIEIPSGLVAAENEAEGKGGAEKTWAAQNVLKFENGYDRAGTAWENDTKVQTRIGEETITLRLAKVVDGRVVPWADPEGREPWRAWALSEVSVRKALCEAPVNPPRLEQAIEAAKKDWTISEKEIQILVLEEEPNGRWCATVSNRKNPRHIVLYSSTTGLEVSTS